MALTAIMFRHTTTSLSWGKRSTEHTGPKFYDWVIQRWTGATTELSVQDLHIKDAQGYSTFVLKPKMDGSVCLSVSWGKVAVHFLGWPPALASWVLRTAGMYMPPVFLLENILRIFDRLIHRSLCWDRQWITSQLCSSSAVYMLTV